MKKNNMIADNQEVRKVTAANVKYVNDFMKHNFSDDPVLKNVPKANSFTEDWQTLNHLYNKRPQYIKAGNKKGLNKVAQATNFMYSKFYSQYYNKLAHTHKNFKMTTDRLGSLIKPTSPHAPSKVQALNVEDNKHEEQASLKHEGTAVKQARVANYLNQNPQVAKKLNIYSGAQAQKMIANENEKISKVLATKPQGDAKPLLNLKHRNHFMLTSHMFHPERLFTGENLHTGNYLSPKALKQNVHAIMPHNKQLVDLADGKKPQMKSNNFGQFLDDNPTYANALNINSGNKAKKQLKHSLKGATPGVQSVIKKEIAMTDPKKGYSGTVMDNMPDAYKPVSRKDFIKHMKDVLPAPGHENIDRLGSKRAHQLLKGGYPRLNSFNKKLEHRNKMDQHTTWNAKQIHHYATQQDKIQTLSSARKPWAYLAKISTQNKNMKANASQVKSGAVGKNALHQHKVAIQKRQERIYNSPKVQHAIHMHQFHEYDKARHDSKLYQQPNHMDPDKYESADIQVQMKGQGIKQDGLSKQYLKYEDNKQQANPNYDMNAKIKNMFHGNGSNGTSTFGWTKQQKQEVDNLNKSDIHDLSNMKQTLNRGGNGAKFLNKHPNLKTRLGVKTNKKNQVLGNNPNALTGPNAEVPYTKDKLIKHTGDTLHEMNRDYNLAHKPAHTDKKTHTLISKFRKEHKSDNIKSNASKGSSKSKRKGLQSGKPTFTPHHGGPHFK